LTSSEALSSEAVHQKRITISCSSEADVIRGSEENQKLEKLEASRLKSKAIWDRA